MRIFNIFSHIDCLASEVGLNIAGSSSIKTKVGGGLSLIYIGVVIWFTYITILDYFDTSRPAVVEEIFSGDDYRKFDLMEFKKMPVMVFYLDRSVQIKSKDVYKYVTVTFRMTTFSRSSPNSPSVSRVSKFFEVVPCSLLWGTSKIESMVMGSSDNVKSIVREFGMCVDTKDDEVFVQGKTPDDLFALTALSVAPCSAGAECLTGTFAEISRVAFTLSVPQVNINMSNLEKPVTYTTSLDDFYFINPNLGQRYQAKLMNNDVRDVLGILPKESLRTQYATNERIQSNILYRNPSQLICTPTEVSKEKCQDYFMFQIISGGGQGTKTRSFKGVIDTLGEIGGVKELLYVGFFYIYYLYHERAAKDLMVEKVYKLKKKKKTTNNKVDPINKKTHETNVHIDGEEYFEASDKVFSKAYDIIEDSLDVITLAKEMNCLRVIASFLMNEYHRVLIPLVSLNIELKKQGRKEEIDRILKQKGQETPNHSIIKAITFSTFEMPMLMTPKIAFGILDRMNKGPQQANDTNDKLNGQLNSRRIDKKILKDPSQIRIEGDDWPEDRIDQAGSEKKDNLVEVEDRNTLFKKDLFKGSLFEQRNLDEENILRPGQADSHDLESHNLKRVLDKWCIAVFKDGEYNPFYSDNDRKEMVDLSSNASHSFFGGLTGGSRVNEIEKS